MRQVAGIHAVREALKVRPHSIKKIVIREGWKDSPELTEVTADAKKHGLKPEIVAISHLDRVLKGHQGVLADVGEDPHMSRERWDQERKQVLLALDGIEDPQNLGAIIRTAWLMGVTGVFLPKGRASPLTAAACKAACGGAEHVPVEIHANVSVPLKILKDKGFWVFGLSASGTQPLWKLKMPDKVIWVIGGEAAGLRSPTEKLCDEMVSLPQADSAASYNASVAAALAMSETKRQWL
ncbi:MAG: RNA methyltransferase [Bdellovibrionia bacterium]